MRTAIPFAFLLGMFVVMSTPASSDEGEGPVSAEALKTHMAESAKRMNDMQAALDALQGEVAQLKQGSEAPDAPGAAPTADTPLDMAAEKRFRLSMRSELAYLRSREAALTAYVLANAERADGLVALAAKCRELGFTMRAIPVGSREALLKGLDGLARSLREGLPAMTPAETALLATARKNSD